MTGRNLKMKSNFLQQAVYWGSARREELEHRAKVEVVIDFLEIQHIRKTPVGRLPYGLQKRVELARALAAEPELLLLDEPMAGMNLEEKQDMSRFHPRRQRPNGHVNRADRARHERGHGPLGSGGRAGLRPQDRRRHTRRGAQQPGRDRTRIWESRTSMKNRGQTTFSIFEERSRKNVVCPRFSPTSMQFFFEVLIGGLLAGVMYSLVGARLRADLQGLGRVQFAQGAMVFFAALTTVGFISMGAPFWLAVALALLAMVALAFFTERVVLRPLVNSSLRSRFFMATIGLTFFIEGIAQLTWGAQVHALGPGHCRRADRMADAQYRDEHQQIRPRRLRDRGRAGWQCSRCSSTRPAQGGRCARSPTTIRRHLPSASRFRRIWVIVWIVAGFVALVTGLLWGARNGVQFALTFLALKALPVLIRAGFESIAGAVVGGLIVGASEKTRRGLHRPARRRGIESWFPYVLALAFLWCARGPVRRAAHRPGLTHGHALPRSRAVQDHLRRGPAALSDPPGPDRHSILLAVVFVGVAARRRDARIAGAIDFKTTGSGC